MANASRQHMSHDGQGKGAGTGALTDMPDDKVGENMILSNRDKAQHSEARGLDSKAVQEMQSQDTEANQTRAIPSAD
jgi:hypothetical protein